MIAARSMLLALLLGGVTFGSENAFPGKQSVWNGYERFDFEVGSKPVTVVVPKKPAEGKPWLWRGEFFGAFPNADIALLGRGFHVVYLKDQNTFGSPQTMRHWEQLYSELTTRCGFAKKMALLGMSRGGLYCYAWAALHPETVGCIYGDAPVCDVKSWPGGKGKAEGSPRNWELFKTAFGLKSDEEALAWKGNPIDRLGPIAEAKIPILHVYGEADEVVPADENTLIIAERYRALGGSITLIPKPGVAHHPHGLEDPTPIVDFIVKHASAR